MADRRVRADDLERFTRQVFEGLGMPPADAAVEAEVLLFGALHPPLQVLGAQSPHELLHLTPDPVGVTQWRFVTFGTTFLLPTWNFGRS